MILPIQPNLQIAHLYIIITSLKSFYYNENIQWGTIIAILQQLLSSYIIVYMDQEASLEVVGAMHIMVDFCTNYYGMPYDQA